MVYFGKNFEKIVVDMAQAMMREHQEADVISEETFRNCRTVTALGAQSKFYAMCEKIVGVNSRSYL